MFKLSFKMKTILGIAVIETFFLFILVLNSRNILYDTIEMNIDERAQSISALLANASTDAVIAHDLATLEAIIDSAMATRNILYIRIRDQDRVLVQRGEQAFLGHKFKADNSITESELDGSYDSYSDIFVEGYKLGRVEIGLSVDEQKTIITKATKHLGVIAVIELFFVALFSLMLGIALTKRLVLLQEAAVKMSRGETGLQIPVKGNDEVSSASRAFNSMSTRIKAITMALQSDNARMEAVMNTATDAIFMINLDGIIQSTNRATYTLFGFQDKELIGHSILSLIPELHFWDMESASIKNVQLAVGKTTDGRNIPVEVHANDMEFDNETYIVGVIRDLSEITGLEHELEAVFNLSASGFLILTKNKTISYVNAAFYSMFSLAEGSLQDHHWLTFVGFINKSIDREQHEDASLLEALATENILYLKQPKEKILRVSRQRIDPSQNESSEILFFDDITHETIVDKMKSQFLTTAAHELRTPLASVMGYSELLGFREYPPEKVKEIAESINRQSKRLKNILDELLDLASIENRAAGVLEMVQDTLETPLIEVCEEMSGSDSFHSIQRKSRKNWPIVEFDQTKIRQILSNILSNAYKYSPESPVVKISTKIKKTGNKAEFGVVVEDKGIGMTPEQLSRVGERFYRADTSGNIPGTGLGISLVKDLVDRHNGQLEIESTLGEGTTVTLWLPVIEMNNSEE